MRQAMNDPFVRARISPDAPYKLVAADTPNLTDLVNGTDLTAPGGPLADSCGSCHRVNTGSNCGFSMGSVANYRGGLDPASAHEHLRRYQGWMPPRAMPLADAEQLRAEVAAACSTR
jgi:hypothetical protein